MHSKNLALLKMGLFLLIGLVLLLGACGEAMQSGSVALVPTVTASGVNAVASRIPASMSVAMTTAPVTITIPITTSGGTSTAVVTTVSYLITDTSQAVPSLTMPPTVLRTAAPTSTGYTEPTTPSVVLTTMPITTTLVTTSAPTMGATPTTFSIRTVGTTTPITIPVRTVTVGNEIPLPADLVSGVGLFLRQVSTPPIISQQEVMRLLYNQSGGTNPWLLDGVLPNGKQATLLAAFGLANIGYLDKKTGVWVGDRNFPIVTCSADSSKCTPTGQYLDHIEKRLMWVLDYGNVDDPVLAPRPGDNPPPFHHFVYAFDIEMRTVIEGWEY